MLITIVLALVFAASIITCHALAKKRGRDPVFWGLMGALFGPLAIPVIYFRRG
jgi:hypothetical protein